MSKTKVKIILFFLFILLHINVYGVSFDINAPRGVVIEYSTGRVLYEKSSGVKAKIASTTKMMTAILAVEKCDLNEIVEVSSFAASTTGSEVGIKAGMKLPLSTLLYGMLLESGNDCATAIAEHVAGSVENFAVLMNEKARELKTYNTNYTNPHGLDTYDNYSTAYDLAIISRYALSIKEIANVLNTKEIELDFAGTKKHLSNTNRLLFSYEYCDGGKTGYTGGANRCFMGTAVKDGMRVIAVVLGADSTDLRFSEVKKMFEYSFSTYKMVNLAEYMNWYVNIPIYKSEKTNYVRYFKDEMTIPLKEGELEKIYIKQTLLPIIISPMKIGACLGDISMYIDNERIYTTEIVLDEEVKKTTVLDYVIKGITHLFDIEVELL